MPVIHLEPLTATNPNQIPATGGTVTFTVRALCPTGAQQARFTFDLQPNDGYRWSNGGTSIQRDAGITEVLTDLPFDLTLQQAAVTGAKFLQIDVQGTLVVGSPPQGSVARLTVGDQLQGLLVAHRAENGLTRADLAAALNISTSWLGKLENGASPSTNLLEAMKQVLEA